MNLDEERKVLISWVTKEHVHHERSIDFYWALGIITLAAAVLAFILRDGLFGALLLIGGGMYGYVSWKKPNDITVAITNKDITIEDEIYPIPKISAFRMISIHPTVELVLVIRRPYQPVISVHVPDELAVEVKEILLNMLPESDTAVPHIGRRFMARYKI